MEKPPSPTVWYRFLGLVVTGLPLCLTSYAGTNLEPTTGTPASTTEDQTERNTAANHGQGSHDQDPAPPSADTLYVTADFLRLRESPQAGAPLIAVLPIGTAVVIEERSDAWARVWVGGRKDVRGWVHTGFLVEDAPTLAGLLESATRAEADGDLSTAIKWLERAVALDPRAREIHERLQALYERTGKTERARAVSALLGRNTGAYIAVCSPDRAILLAHVRPPHTLRPLAEHGAKHAEPAKHIDEIRRLRWLAVSDDGLALVPPERFVKPFLTPLFNEIEPTPYEPADYSPPCPDEEPSWSMKVVLGSCDQDDALLTTDPLATVTGRTLEFGDATVSVERNDQSYPTYGLTWRCYRVTLTPEKGRRYVYEICVEGDEVC